MTTQNTVLSSADGLCFNVLIYVSYSELNIAAFIATDSSWRRWLHTLHSTTQFCYSVLVEISAASAYELQSMSIMP